MITTIVSCAMLLNLSMTTKIEMNRIFPQIGSYCLSHPQGNVKVTYALKESRQ